MTELTELKQACLDLSKASIELFDRLEAHGYEAAWEGDGVLVIVELSKAHETLRSFFAQQSVQRLIQLGVPPETLIRVAEGKDPRG